MRAARAAGMSAARRLTALGRLVAGDLRAVLRGAPRYANLAFPGEEGGAAPIPCRPGLYEASQLDRVTGFGFGSRMPREIAKISATEVEPRPTQIATLENAVVLGGKILAGAARHFVSARSEYAALRAPMPGFDAVFTPSSMQGLRYFGHWLRDDCSAFEIARDRRDAEAQGGTGGEILALRRPRWDDCAVYEAGFGQSWTERDAFFARRLTCIRDIGFNLAKKRRWEVLRARLRAGRAEAGPPGRIVYLKRGKSAVRRGIADEDALIARLAAAGAAIVEPETDPAALIAACLDAALIITIEGSQAAHGVYLLAEGGSLLVLQPPQRFYNPHVEWTRLMGMGYGIVVGRPDGEDMRVDPGEVLAMADRLLATQGRLAEI